MAAAEAAEEAEAGAVVVEEAEAVVVEVVEAGAVVEAGEVAGASEQTAELRRPSAGRGAGLFRCSRVRRWRPSCSRWHPPLPGCTPHLGR